MVVAAAADDDDEDRLQRRRSLLYGASCQKRPIGDTIFRIRIPSCEMVAALPPNHRRPPKDFKIKCRFCPCVNARQLILMVFEWIRIHVW
jgi:hypothetical protein